MFIIIIVFSKGRQRRQAYRTDLWTRVACLGNRCVGSKSSNFDEASMNLKWHLCVRGLVLDKAYTYIT